MMQHLDLFSGIGGFALAARLVGWQTVAFCEIEPYCRDVLRKHWPAVPIFEDVRKLAYTAATNSPMRPGFLHDKETFTRCSIDIITGGFPCQDISVAGKGAGIDGEQSGLWAELARVIGEVRPRFAVVENVTALLARGLERVTGDLAALGYCCEWHCIPASAVGAPHQRDRVWIVAYSVGGPVRDEQQRRECRPPVNRETLPENDGVAGNVAHTDKVDADTRRPGASEVRRQRQTPSGVSGSESVMADAAGLGVERDRPARLEIPRLPISPQILGRYRAGRGADHWRTEPDVGRVADGIPARVDRLKGLGNAIVPANAVLIFESIINFDRSIAKGAIT